MKRDVDKREAAINSYTLREHQLVLLDMLKDIDQICKKYDIISIAIIANIKRKANIHTNIDFLLFILSPHFFCRIL